MPEGEEGEKVTLKIICPSRELNLHRLREGKSIDHYRNLSLVYDGVSCNKVSYKIKDSISPLPSIPQIETIDIGNKSLPIILRPQQKASQPVQPSQPCSQGLAAFSKTSKLRDAARIKKVTTPILLLLEQAVVQLMKDDLLRKKLCRMSYPSFLLFFLLPFFLHHYLTN